VMPISMDGTDPAGWDPTLDSLAAAPANHLLLYEDESIRVLSVSIAPGEREQPHHHRWPSVFVIDAMPGKMCDFDATGREIPLPIPEKYELPLTVRMPPQPVHYVRNEDSIGFHGTRIEFKRGFPV
jgi:predicted metal-dependent enzyme (double-stranded beta helix superfamily)